MRKYTLLIALFFVCASSAQAKTRPAFSADVRALALNIYHESHGLRGPSNLGWRSVAAVVFNRMEDARFPKTLRGVVYQGNLEEGTCAFSWYCDDLPDVPGDSKLYQEILREAQRYVYEYTHGVWRDPTWGAHSYHALTMSPNKYFKRLELVRVVREGRQGHMFYRDHV